MGLLGAFGRRGDVAVVSTTSGGFAPGVVPGRTGGGKAAPFWSAASCSCAASRCTSWVDSAWKSCDWRPLTGVTGSITSSLSVSSPSSSIGCVRSVGYCRGDDERLDLLEPGRSKLSRIKGIIESAAALIAGGSGRGAVAEGRREKKGMQGKPPAARI